MIWAKWSGEGAIPAGLLLVFSTAACGGKQYAEQTDEVARAEATAQAQLYQYGQTLLQALQEVEDALVLENQHSAFIESLREQRDSAQQTLELARQRYQRGAADYLRVLTALQSLQSIEQSLLDARRQQLSYRLQLCRALGGSWTRELESSLADDSELSDGSGSTDGADSSKTDSNSSESSDAPIDRPSDPSSSSDSYVAHA